MRRATPPWSRSLGAAAVAAVLFGSPKVAHAFERQWHVGGGVGFADATNGYPAGPALGLYGAYGLTDVFDLRLELTGSRHTFSDVVLTGAAPADASFTLLGARAGLAYKLDVIQWIPYFGVSAGGLLILAPEGANDARASTLGAFVGLDYALSRNVGLGVYSGLDYLLSTPTMTYGALLIRAEYRFGW